MLSKPTLPGRFLETVRILIWEVLRVQCVKKGGLGLYGLILDLCIIQRIAWSPAVAW